MPPIHMMPRNYHCNTRIRYNNKRVPCGTNYQVLAVLAGIPLLSVSIPARILYIALPRSMATANECTERHSASLAVWRKISNSVCGCNPCGERLWCASHAASKTSTRTTLRPDQSLLVTGTLPRLSPLAVPQLFQASVVCQSVADRLSSCRSSALRRD